jgi:hypothetical protein
MVDIAILSAIAIAMSAIGYHLYRAKGGAWIK